MWLLDTPTVRRYARCTALYCEDYDGITHDRYRKGLLDLSIKDTEVLWLCNDDSISLEKYEDMCETGDMEKWRIAPMSSITAMYEARDINSYDSGDIIKALGG